MVYFESQEMEPEKRSGTGPAEPGSRIREWYHRSTRKARSIILWSSALAVPLSVLFYFTASRSTILSLQLYNGAVTIPVVAAIWIAVFVWIFLIPSRECGFRSVESVERTEGMIRDLVEERLPAYWEKDIAPVLATWRRIGERLEKRVDERTLDKLASALDALAELGAGGSGPPNPRKGLSAFAPRAPVAAAGRKEAP